MGVKKDKRTGNVVKGDDGKPIKVYNDVPMELLRLVRGQKAVGVNDPARMVKTALDATRQDARDDLRGRLAPRGERDHQGEWHAV